MATPKEDVLEFEVLVDIRDSLKAIEKFQREMTKSMKTVAKGGEKMGQGATKAAKKAKVTTDEWGRSVREVGAAYKKEDEEVSNLSKTIRALSKQAKKLSGEERITADAEIAGLKKIEAARKKLSGGAGATPPKGGLFFGRFTPEKVKKELAEAGEALKEPLQAFLQKDLGRIFEGSMKGAGAVFSRSVKFTKAMAEMGATSLHKRAEETTIKGKAKGGVEGARLQAAGASMKTMAGMMGKIGGMMGALSALAPLLATATTAVVGLVKMFIDADAMVKDFNRGVMESASNLEFLERAGGSATGAIMNMGDALEGVRAAAMDPGFNNALGITKDTHTAILNTLTQEGVAFGNLAAEAGNTAEGMKTLTQSIVATGVAYSRSFGVPLAEITTLQAEMAVEMGNSIKDTTEAFRRMANAAAGSGIAGNKFFNIIRAASADLSLWNLRLDGAIDLLGKLGKVMSPRGAQAFFQSISSGFKNMGRQDLLKQTLMAGVENVRDVLKQDVGESQKELAKEIMSAGGAEGENLERVVEKLRTGGYGAADKLIRGVKDTSKIGTLRGKAAEIERKSQGAAGGTYEVSQASGEIQGIGGQLSILMRAVESMGGSLLKPNKMALSQTAEALGMSQEQVRQLHSLALAADAQKKILIAQGKKSPAEIAKMTWQEIIDSDESLKSQSDKLEKDNTAVQKTVQESVDAMSEAQGQKTQSLTDKLDNLVNWFMNTFYNLMIDIWDAIMSIPGVGGGASQKDKRAIYKSGNAELIQAFDKALDKDGKLNFNALKGGVAGGATGSKLDTLTKTEGGRERVASTVGASFSGTDILSMGKMSGLSEDKMAALQEKLTRKRTVADSTSGYETSYSGIAGKGEVGDLGALLKELNLTTKEQAELLSKAGWAASDVDTLTSLAKGLGGAGAGPTSPVQVTADAADTTNEHLETVAADNKKTQTLMKQQGIKIAPATIKEQDKGMEASMLSALRTALFEFYMYSGTDRGTMLAAMKSGGVTDTRQVGPTFTGGAAEGGSALSGVTSVATPAKANASGGLVTGIANGMAIVAAQGEGLASVGRGERITPAGGGGAPSVHVSVNGIGGQDLARLIEGKVVDGIREYKRRERFS